MSKKNKKYIPNRCKQCQSNIEEKPKLNLFWRIMGLIGAVVSIVLTLMGQAILENHRHNLNQQPILNNHFSNATFAAEFINDDCSSSSKDKSKHLYTHVEMLRTDLGALINQSETMGHLKSKETYCIIHNFSSLYNQVQTHGDSACQAPRLTTDELTALRIKQFLPQSNADVRSRQNILSALDEYIKPSITTYDYNTKDCQNSETTN